MTPTRVRVGPCTSCVWQNQASQPVQNDQNKFLSGHFLYVLLPCRVIRCPKGRSEGVWAAPSLKAIRPPIEHDERSSSMWRSANPSKGAKASITRSLVPPPVSRAVQCKRSDRIAKNVEIAHDGWRRRIRPMVATGIDKKRSKSPFLAPFGHLTRQGSKK